MGNLLLLEKSDAEISEIIREYMADYYTLSCKHYIEIHKGSTCSCLKDTTKEVIRLVLLWRRHINQYGITAFQSICYRCMSGITSNSKCGKACLSAFSNMVQRGNSTGLLRFLIERALVALNPISFTCFPLTLTLPLGRVGEVPSPFSQHTVVLNLAMSAEEAIMGLRRSLATDKSMSTTLRNYTRKVMQEVLYWAKCQHGCYTTLCNMNRDGKKCHEYTEDDIYNHVVERITDIGTVDTRKYGWRELAYLLTQCSEVCGTKGVCTARATYSFGSLSLLVSFILQTMIFSPGVETIESLKDLEERTKFTDGAKWIAQAKGLSLPCSIKGGMPKTSAAKNNKQSKGWQFGSYKPEIIKSKSAEMFYGKTKRSG